jgi:hypothetical protein
LPKRECVEASALRIEVVVGRELVGGIARLREVVQEPALRTAASGDGKTSESRAATNHRT